LKRAYLIFFLIAISITIRTIIGFKDLATSSVPGFHVTVFTPYFIISLLSLIWLFILSILYYFLELKKRFLNTKFLLMHIALTIPFLLIINFPIMDSEVNLINQIFMFEIVLLLFVSGQILFIWQFYRRII
jgi:hypothetical protein